jgi:hypothetical protein
MDFEIITNGGTLAKWFKDSDGKWSRVMMNFFDDNKVEFCLDGKSAVLQSRESSND